MEESSSSPAPPPDDTNNSTESGTTTTAATATETPTTASTSMIIPQLAADGITQADMDVTIRVLTAIGKLNKKKKRKRKSQPEQQQQQNNNNDDNKEMDGLELYKQSNLRPLRKALAGCLELHKRTMFEGKTEEEHYEQRKAERSLKRQKMAERDMQKKHIADTQLRRGRVAKLNNLKMDAREEEETKFKNNQKLASLEMMIPDGHVDTTTTSSTTTNPKLLLNQPMEEEEESTEATTTTNNNNIKLPKLRSCYVCKVRYRDLHHFYDQLCPKCATLNWTKRHQIANMEGKVAIVTGSRVKIGLQVTLKLLRCGATVVATTRFPNSAAAVYRSQSDFNTWKHRLNIYGLDLRDVTGLEAFTRYLKITYGPRGGIDVLINNACQTIRRPRGYYIPMVQQEQQLWQKGDETHKSLLEGCQQFETLRRKLHHHQSQQQEGSRIHSLEAAGSAQAQDDTPLLMMGMETTTTTSDSSSKKAEKLTTNPSTKDDVALVKTSTTKTTRTKTNDDNSNQQQLSSTSSTTISNFESSGLSHSAAMSQMIILPEDVGVSDSVLPPGMTDINGQQLDLRTNNSWLLKMEQVSTPEVMECMFINAIAPFVLNSRLKPLMVIDPPQQQQGDDATKTTTSCKRRRPDRYIINVSAMEGKFYRYKMPNHPHTNMAKAALNMMTRTSAEDLAKKHRIYMNSVDTGWINDENPLEKASKTAVNNLFQTPIDEIDAASRILDPVFTGVNNDDENDGTTANGEGDKEYGKFLKDYRETEW